MTGGEDGSSRGSAVDPMSSDPDATRRVPPIDPAAGPDATRRLPPVDAPLPGSAGKPAVGSADEPTAVVGRPVPAEAGVTGTGAAGAAVTAEPVVATRRPRGGNWRRVASRFELPILIVVAIAIAVLLKTFVIQPFYIPSQSMEQTLHGCPGCAGDRILVFKPVYQIRDPHAGDIVVFKAPVDWDEPGGQMLSSNPVVHGIQWFGQLVGVVPPSEKDLVKRVIAVGGQTVKCCDDNGNVQISEHGPDGPWRSLDERYIYQNSPWSKPTRGAVRSPEDTRSFGPVTVPAGRLWVLGDHRGDSADSRYHCGAAGSGAGCDPVSSTVPISDVIGKAVAIAWPPSRWRSLGTPATFTALGPVGLPVEPGSLALAGAVVIGGVRRRRR